MFVILLLSMIPVALLLLLLAIWWIFVPEAAAAWSPYKSAADIRLPTRPPPDWLHFRNYTLSDTEEYLLSKVEFTTFRPQGMNSFYWRREAALRNNKSFLAAHDLPGYPLRPHNWNMFRGDDREEHEQIVRRDPRYALRRRQADQHKAGQAAKLAFSHMVSRTMPDIQTQEGFDALIYLLKLASGEDNDVVLRRMALGSLQQKDEDIEARVRHLSLLGEARANSELLGENVPQDVIRQLEHTRPFDPSNRFDPDTLGKVEVDAQPLSSRYHEDSVPQPSTKRREVSEVYLEVHEPPENERAPLVISSRKRRSVMDEPPPLPDYGQDSMFPDIRDGRDARRAQAKALRYVQRAFEAYDCQEPQQLETVRTVGKTSCDIERPEVETYEAEYWLLQEAPFIRIPTKHCGQRVSQIPFHCNPWDYATVQSSDIKLNAPVPVSPTTCRSWFDTLEYKVQQERTTDEWEEHSYTLAINATNQIRTEIAGHTFAEDSSELECEGVRWYSESKKMEIDRTVVMEQADITLREEEIVADKNGRLVVFSTQERLPPHCRLSAGACETSMGTWLWNAPSEAETCRLFRTRKLKGQLSVVWDPTEGEHGKAVKTFVDKENMVRLIFKEQRFLCGREIIATNYERLFLASLEQENHFEYQELNPLDMSPFVFSNNKLDFTAAFLEEGYKTYINNLLIADCQKRIEAAGTHYSLLAAEQNALRAGTTVGVGDGRFVTAAGEVFHRYRCRPITVMAKETERCYDALPVTLDPTDFEYFRTLEQQRREQLKATEGFEDDDFIPIEQTRFFLTPLTHRVVTAAVEVPCSVHLAPRYKNINDDWVMVTPSLVPAAPPKSLESVDTRQSWAERQNSTGSLDFANSGIYTPAALLELETASQLPRLRDQIQHRLAPTTYGGRYINPEAASRRFRAQVQLSPLDIKKYWEKAKDALSVYGYTASIVFATISLLHIIHQIFKKVAQLCWPDQSERLAWYQILCPLGFLCCTCLKGWMTRLRRHTIPFPHDDAEDQPPTAQKSDSAPGGRKNTPPAASYDYESETPTHAKPASRHSLQLNLQSFRPSWGRNNPAPDHRLLPGPVVRYRPPPHRSSPDPVAPCYPNLADTISVSTIDSPTEETAAQRPVEITFSVPPSAPPARVPRV